MSKNETAQKTSPQKNLIFKLQNDLSFEKSKNYQLSQELFELKLELASTKNNLLMLQSELQTYKIQQKKYQTTIESLKLEIKTLQTPNISSQASTLMIKRPLFNSVNTEKSFNIDSPQTKIVFTPFQGKKYDPNDDLDDMDSDDSMSFEQNLFKKSSKSVIGNQIFEDFLIIGAGDEEIFEVLEKKSDISGNFILNPKILYSYKNSLKNDHLTTILHCAFPFGIESKRLKLTDSFSSLNEILFSSNTLFEQREHSFVFVLKCNEDIEKEINCQYKISLNSKTQLRKVSLLQTCNPNHLKYCICFIVNDYQHFLRKTNKINKKKASKTSINNNFTNSNHNNFNNNNNISENEESFFFSTKKVYCFVSYYPFIKFFTDVIISILNYFKLNKMKFYHEKNQENPLEIYKRLDSSFLHNEMNKELELILKNIYENPIPCFSSTLNFPNFDELKAMIEFKIPAENLCVFLEGEWVSSCVFSNLKCEQFISLFLGLMLEKILVFFTKNLAILTSTLMTLICCLKPFTWPYPMIFNIPESLLEFLDSPVPILVGINQGKEYIIGKKLDKLHQECIFVNLDDVEIFNYNNLQEEVNSQFFHQMAYKLKSPFDDLRDKQNKNFNIGKKDIIMNPSQKDKEICLKILEIIKNSLEIDILGVVKKSKCLQKKEVNPEEIAKENNIKDNFIKKFLATQMFTYFICNSSS